MAASKSTKSILAQALKELMSAQPFAKISVGDICTHCGVSRKSFYYHFQDKYDLMNWIFYTEFIETLQQPGQEDGWQLLLGVCAYLYEERVFYRNALNVRGQNSFHDYFIETTEPFFRIFVEDAFPKAAHPDFYVTFYTDAFLSAILRWLNDPEPLPPKHFATLLRNALNGPR